MVLGTFLLDKVKEGRGLSKPYVTGEWAVDTFQIFVAIDQSLMTSMSGVFQRTAELGDSEDCTRQNQTLLWNKTREFNDKTHKQLTS